ncbi:MAG TPA: hypothetical protein VKA50_02925 [Gammaproteobacteria bacterium]|nr:hypothetical protein [Gammaproteobacteria bacterium]
MTISRVVLCGLLFVTAPCAFGANTQNATVKLWTVDAHGDFVRYVTHGNTVHGHELGFIKKAGHCNGDILWISWSTYKKGLKAYEGTNATFRFHTGKTSFSLPLPLLSTFNFKHLLTAAAFTNFAVNGRFITLLKGHDAIDLIIAGPKKLADRFDVHQDSFSLMGFAQARDDAKAMCQKL